MADRDVLWREYERTQSPEAREALIVRYAYLAKYVVDRMYVGAGCCLTREDLIGHALVGLISAFDRFEPGRGVKFETFAMPRVRGAVVDTLRSLDWAPRSVRRLEIEIRETYARLEAELGRCATDDDVAAALGMSPDAFQEALANISIASVTSLEDAVSTNRESAAPLTLEGVVSSGPTPADVAEETERTRLLADALRALPERERLVVSLYYYEGLTLKEIGRALEVTEARVSQIHTKAILRLSGKLQRLQPVLCE